MATEIETLTKNVDTAVHALAKSVRSIVEDDDLDHAQTSSALRESFDQYQKHLHELIPAGISKAVTAAVEVAKIKSTAAADEEGQPMKGNQMTQAVHNFVKKYSTSPPDPQAAREIVNIAKAINSGTATGNYASKAAWFQVMKRLAEQDRKSDQSSEQAFAAFIQTPDGAELFKAHKSASGPDYQPVAVEVPIVKVDSAYSRLKKIARDLCEENPDLTEGAAFLKVFTDPANRELAEQSKRESAFA
jgi:hypothetical protein